MGSVQRRVYPVDDETQLIFTDVERDRGRGSLGPTLSIVSDKSAHVRRLGPDFGPALEAVIKQMMERRAS